MPDAEIDRIIKMHISPINVSVHTTNPVSYTHLDVYKRQKILFYAQSILSEQHGWTQFA